MGGPTLQPWEIDPDGPPRALTLGETLFGLEHFGAFWIHATNIQDLKHDLTPDGPPRDGILLLAATAVLPKPLSLAVRCYEKELKALADVRGKPCDLPWKVGPPPPPTLEEAEQAMRELRVMLWLDELGREAERRAGGPTPS
jgi:hypothetical protein